MEKEKSMHENDYDIGMVITGHSHIIWHIKRCINFSKQNTSQPILLHTK